ncbi:MAG: glycosyltransferase N-terminal domain-containing protein [Prevotella sp.]|nr:glycosyltransferase N-terminal domain-containing protein [Prevotella sp.]
MYNIVMSLYELGVVIYSLFNAKVRKMWKGERDAVRILKEKMDPDAEYIWFHAASLGEFEQGRPLIEQIRKDHPKYKILLTFFSPSGYEVRKNYEGADIVTYLPIDTVINARRFLRTVRPVMAFFIKYEFWYNYLHILRHRHVPVYSVSSIFRPSQVFFQWYGREYGHVLRCFTRFYVQNDESRHLLNKIGVKDVEVVGDTRFDRVIQIQQAAKKLPIVEAFRSSIETVSDMRHPTTGVFVAGSSWPPDEEIFIDYFNKRNDWKLIIAPHVVSENHLNQIISLIKNKKVVRYTQTNEAEAKEADVLIIDCYGLLSSIYHYGDVAYVGGGFGVGIHNVLEAAVWNIPVIFGPNNKRFDEAQGLIACKGGFEISTADDFDDIMTRLDGDRAMTSISGQAAGAYVQHLAGATKRVLASINSKENERL